MNIDEARELAQDSAIWDLQGIYSGGRDGVLAADHLEAEHCWMFFQHPSIKIPPERSLSAFAYVFGKNGGGRCVGDMRSDPRGLADYLQQLSDYFANHTE